MARAEEKKTINGNEWAVTPWPGMHGVRMQARLAPKLKGIAGTLSSAMSGKEVNQDEAAEQFMNMDVSKLLEAILDSVDDSTPQLLRDLLHGARVNGKDITMDGTFNEHFAGNYKELYQGLWFVLQTNLSDVFPEGVRTGSPDENQ